jgi:hypothetical protein
MTRVQVREQGAPSWSVEQWPQALLLGAVCSKARKRRPQ